MIAHARQIWNDEVFSSNTSKLQETWEEHYKYIGGVGVGVVGKAQGRSDVLGENIAWAQDSEVAWDDLCVFPVVLQENWREQGDGEADFSQARGTKCESPSGVADWGGQDWRAVLSMPSQLPWLGRQQKHHIPSCFSSSSQHTALCPSLTKSVGCQVLMAIPAQKGPAPGLLSSSKELLLPQILCHGASYPSSSQV